MNRELINKNRRAVFIIATSLFCATAGAANASPITAGDFDNFGNQGSPADALVIRPAFASYLSRAVPGGNNDAYHNGDPMPFDERIDRNWEFGYTFLNLPQLSADSRLRIRLQSRNGSENDSVSLQFTGTDTSYSALWSGGMGALDAEFGGSGTWEAGKTAIFDIRLGDLPFTNGMSIVDEINLAGYLDVYVQDDTAVDWIQVVVPAPGTASLLAVGGLAAVRRRRA